MGYGEQVNIHFIKNRLIRGKSGLPIVKLRILCELSGTPLEEAEKHIVKIKPRSGYATEYFGLG